MKKLLFLLLGLLLIPKLCFGAVPEVFTNGVVADATAVNSDMNYFEGKFSTTSGHTHNGTNSNATLAGTWSGSPISAAYGGTGLASYASGDMLYATADSGFARLAKGSIGSVMIVGADKNEPTWLEPGTSGYVLTTQGIGLNPYWGISGSQSSRVVGATSSPTTTSATYVDLTDMSITLTTGAKPVFVSFDGTFYNGTGGAATFAILDIDGSNITGTESVGRSSSASDEVPLNISWLQTMSAGSHTWKIQWKVSAGTSTAWLTNRRLTVIEFK